MQCEFILFADAANFSQEGKVNLLGEFSILQTSNIAAVTSGKLLAKFTGTQAEIGPHSISMRVLTADGQLLIASPTETMQLGSPRLEGIPPQAWVLTDLPPVPFPAPGIYAFEFYVDGQRLDTVGELHVVRAP